jgi:CHRD domain
MEVGMTRVTLRVVAVGAAIALLGVASYAFADGGFSRSNVHLIGYQEVPAVSTVASGKFKATIRGDRIDWSLRYEDLEGDVQQAHIHFGQLSVNGGISVFLCTNLGNGPTGTQGAQACPPDPATVSGTIQAADVSPNIPATAAARTQGIGTGEFNELVAAIRAGATYANVHTTTWPGGEIRAQLGGRGDDDD